MANHISEDEVVARIKACTTFMQKFVDIDRTRCRNFLDPSVVPFMQNSGTDESVTNILMPDIQVDVPIGQTNLLTASILVKLAVIAINRPDWHVTAQKQEEGQDGQPTGRMVSDPESAMIWRQYMRDDWDRKNNQRTAMMALLKRYVSGLGCVAWGWDDAGPFFEHVQTWDYGVDPFVTDWQDVKYGRRRIRMSLTTAVERYPNGPFKEMIGVRDSGKMNDVQIVEVEIYWDKDTESHIYDNKRIYHTSIEGNKDKDANLYSRVPLLFLEGDQHPGRSPFPIGDSVLAAGAQAEISDLTQSISNTAKAGTGFLLFDTAGDQINKAVTDAMEKGEQQQMIGVKGLDTNNLPVHRIAGEELRPAVLQAKQEARDDLMSLIGISSMDMGLFNDRPQFATQVAATVQKGGARQNQAKAEYETFLNRWGKITLWLFKEFGGPHRTEDGEIVGSMELQTLHDAAKNVTDISIIESSTSYKDPSMQQQQSMQLVQLLSSIYPMLVNLATMGLMTKLPSMEKALDRLFRSFDISETDQMWQDYQPPQQPPAPEDKPKVSINYKDLPEDTKRSAEADAGLQPSQVGSPQEGPDMSPHVDLEKQARDHLHEAGMQAQEHRHALDLAQIQAQQQQNLAKLQSQTQLATAKKNGATKNGSK